MSLHTVGVIGGMGPAATTLFMARVQALTPAARDQDHLRLIVDCNPRISDRNVAAKGEGPTPEAALAGMARGLQSLGAQLLVMPCNTAHAYAAAIADAVAIPFLDLIEAVADEAAREGPARVGVLAGDGCLEAGLYQQAFARRGVAVVVPSPGDQARFMTLLYRIKAGDLTAPVRRGLAELAEDLVARGAETIVAGCTEIPLVLTGADLAVPLVDSLETLAKRTVEATR